MPGASASSPRPTALYETQATRSESPIFVGNVDDGQPDEFLFGRAMPISVLAASLSRPLDGTQVIDKTGLEGNFDVDCDTCRRTARNLAIDQE